MQTRLTKRQIDELEDALNGVLRWSLSYSHLGSLERAAALGFRAVRDLRERLPDVPVDAGANLRSEEPAA